MNLKNIMACLALLAAGTAFGAWYDNPGVLKSVTLAKDAKGTVDPHYMSRTADGGTLLVNLQSNGDNAGTVLVDLQQLADPVKDGATVRTVVAKPSDGYGSDWKGGAISSDLKLALVGSAISSEMCAFATEGEVWLKGTSLKPLTNDKGYKMDGLAFGTGSAYLYSNVNLSDADSKRIARWTYDAANNRLVWTGEIDTGLTRVRNISVYNVGGRELVYCGEGADGTTNPKVVTVDVTDADASKWTAHEVSSGLSGLKVVTNVKLSNIDTAPVMYVLCNSGELAVCTLAADGLSVSEVVKAFTPAETKVLAGGTASSPAKFRNFEVTDDGKTAFFINRADEHNAAVTAVRSLGYIESLGVTGLNTGYFVNAKTKIEIDFQLTKDAGTDSVSHQMRLFGQNGTGCGNYAVIYFGDTARNYKVGYGNSFNGAYLAPRDMLRHTIVYDSPNNVCKIFTAGVEKGSATLSAAHDGTAAFPMGVFAETTNADGTSFGNKAYMRLYGLKIYEDGKLLHAFVPAKSGAIGLYDEIDGNFIAAPISGFTSGGDLKDLGGEPATDAYIESDGSQFMNTGYYPNGKTRIELDYSIPTFEDTTSYVQMRLLDNNPTAQGVDTIAATVYVAGTAQSGDYTLAMAICNRAKGAALSGTWTAAASSGGTKAKYCDSTRRTLVLDEYGKAMSIQEAGETKWYQTVSTANSNTSAWPLGLFGRTISDKYGNSCDYRSRIRVYGLKIFEANVLVHDYRPVKQAGVVGLKDSVTGRFLSDSRKSPGAFTASADVPEIPDDPYIESDGTSAISTGIIPKPGLKVEIDYAFTDVSDPKPDTTDHYQQRLFGVDTTSGDIPRVCLYINASQNISLAYGNGWIAESTGIKADLLRHTVSLGEGTDGWLYQRGPTVWAHWTKAAITNTMPAATRPMALFGNANDDAGTKFTRLSKVKIYRARFWIGETLVRDFQPRVQDGVAGFEDLAQGGFYTCAGLTASANVPAIRGETDAYVESDGTATSSVNTYYYANPKTKVEVDYQLKGYQSGVVVMGAYNCGFSCLIYCDSTSAASGGGIFQPSASDDGYNAVGLTPTLRTDCLRHTAVIDVPARSVRITAPDGTVQSSGTISKACTKTATMPLTIFGAATDVYGAVKQQANARIFGIKIWEKEGDVYVLKRDLKPQVKGGVVGFKDVVTGAFLTNERKTAAQALKCGGAIPVVEDDPYILANGTDNQTVDTGYKTTGSTRIEADFAFMSTGNYSGHQQILFGNAADKVNFNGYINGGDNFAYSCNADDVAPNKYTSLDVPSSLARKTMIIDPTAGYTYLVTQGFTNKTSAITAAVSGRTNAYTMPIFTRRNTASLGSNYPYAKLYGFRIYEDGVLQRDYVPYKGADGVGLRDAKTGDKIFNSTAATKPLTYGGKPALRTEFDSVPQDAKVFAGETATLTASAADAFAYQWFLDGVAIAGATGESCTAVWQKKPHQTAVYTVRAFFDVDGETVVREASAMVTSMPRGAAIIIR